MKTDDVRRIRFKTILRGGVWLGELSEKLKMECVDVIRYGFAGRRGAQSDQHQSDCGYVSVQTQVVLQGASTIVLPLFKAKLQGGRQGPSPRLTSPLVP